MQRLKASLVQIMKSDEDVRMISAEAPVLFAKVRLLACCSVCSCRRPARHWTAGV